MTYDDFVSLAAHQTVFSVACSSDSEILAVLQTKKDIILTPISFRCTRLVAPGKGFVAIRISVGLSSGLPQ